MESKAITSTSLPEPLPASPVVTSSTVGVRQAGYEGNVSSENVSANSVSKSSASTDEVRDAVRVELSVSKNKVDVGEDPSQSKASESKEESRDKEVEKEMQEAAKLIEKEFNHTAVKFQVGIAGSGDSELRFQVIEKETGKVVREFPPEPVLNHLRQKGGDSDLKGVIIADKA